MSFIGKAVNYIRLSFVNNAKKNVWEERVVK